MSEVPFIPDTGSAMNAATLAFCLEISYLDWRGPVFVTVLSCLSAEMRGPLSFLLFSLESSGMFVLC